MERATARTQRNTGGRLSQGSLVSSCTLVGRALAQVLRGLNLTKLEGHQWLQSQTSPWFCHQPLRQTGWPARPPSQSCGRLPARELAHPPFWLQNLNQIKSAGAQILTSFHFCGLWEKEGGSTGCSRKGAMKGNFIFDHIGHFSEYTRVQLG